MRLGQEGDWYAKTNGFACVISHLRDRSRIGGFRCDDCEVVDMTSPCYGCMDRQMACHDECKAYLAWRHKQLAIKTAIAADLWQERQRRYQKRFPKRKR